MKILIVDDSSFKRKALAYVIESHGHEVVETGDVQDGLEKARVFIPDIIVSNILMPTMDGFQFLRNIKKDEQLSDISLLSSIQLSLQGRRSGSVPLAPAALLKTRTIRIFSGRRYGKS